MDVERFSETRQIYTKLHGVTHQNAVILHLSLSASSRQILADFFVAAMWRQIAEPSSG
jgi:hypothetical protein